MQVLQKIRQWLGQAERGAEGEAGGEVAVTTPPPGSDTERETSTNAQVEGAAGQPWPGNE